jgi:NodT family efflux transporter outer membrane factor (OMF) lipoprotein
MNSAHHLLTAGSLVLLLGACAANPPVENGATVPVATAWKQPAAISAGKPAVITAPWWRAFADPALDRLIAQALSGNFDLRIALSRYDAAMAAARIAGADLYPSVRANVAAERRKIARREFEQTYGTEHSFEGPRVNNPTNRFVVATEVGYEIDLWGRVRKAVAAGEAEAQASAFDLDATRLSLAAMIARTYFSMRTLDTRLALGKQQLETANAALELALRRRQAGVADATESLRLQRDIRQLEEGRQTLLEERAAAENQLAVLLGKPPAEVRLAVGGSATTIAVPEVPVRLPVQVFAQRPDVRAAQARLIAAQARGGEAQSAALPRLTLGGTVGFTTDVLRLLIGSSSFGWAVGPQLQLPLFEGGRIQARIDAAQSEAEQAQYAYQLAALRAFEEVENALGAVATSAERFRATDDSLRVLAQMQTDLERQLQAGRLGRLSLLSAQAGLLSAQEARLLAHQARLDAAITLYKALGGGWETTGG